MLHSPSYFSEVHSQVLGGTYKDGGVSSDNLDFGEAEQDASLSSDVSPQVRVPFPHRICAICMALH